MVHLAWDQRTVEKSPFHSLTEQRSRIDSGSHNWGYGRGTFEAVL